MHPLDLRFDIASTGFKYANRFIHTFIGGSELHGAKLDATDDHDVMGIYVEPPEDKLGLHQIDFFKWSTASDAVKNGPGDIDLVTYGLGKWAGLAVNGNPSILNYLFAPNHLPKDWSYYHELMAWSNISAHKDWFLARTHWKKFAGYADAQRKRMTGERSKKVNRPELVERFGYDTKFAMHTIRILSEGLELLSTGRISFPSHEVDLLREIRRGERSQEWVIKECESRMAELELIGTSNVPLPIPDEIDHEKVSKLLSEVYQMYWKGRH